MAIQTQLNDRSVDTAAFAAAVATVEENSVTILSPDLLLKGEYVQNGDDLIIRGDLGEEITVEGYFSGDTPPVLETTAGAMLHPDTVQKLLINTDSIDVAGPAGSISIPGLLGDPIGTIDEMGGDVTAKGADGVIRTLQEGDPIYQNDLVETVGRSYANLRMVDGTSFQLGKETRAIIENYSYTPGVESGQFEATVVSGFFRYASGSLGGLDKGTHTTIKTPTAQIGVRGSEMEGVVESDGSSTFVHKEGVLDVSDANGRGTVTLDQPGMATAVSIRPGAPEPAFDAPDELKARFEEALPPVPDFVAAANEEEELVEELLEVPVAAEGEEESDELEEFELGSAVLEAAPEDAQVEEGVRQNAVPKAFDDLITGLEDGGNLTGSVTPITGSLAVNDQLGDGSHTWFVASDPQHGILELNSDGSFSYIPEANYNGADSFSYTVKDADGDESTSTVTIDLTAVNDAPEATGSDVLFYTEGGAPATDQNVTLSDVDDGFLTGATISLQGELLAGDLLNFAEQNGIIGSYDSDIGVLTLSGIASIADYQQALRSVTYQSTSYDPTSDNTELSRVVTWVVMDANSDGVGVGVASSTPFSSTIEITAVNNAPMITGGDTSSYPEQGAAIVVDETISLTDLDDTQVTRATVQISNGLTEGDLLQLPEQSSGITASYDNVTGVLTLSGSATVEEYQIALRAVTYSSSSDDPTVNAASRTITWSVTDANSDQVGAATGTGIATIDVTAINDEPVVAQGEATLTYIENGDASIIDGTITLSDLDDTQITGASVTLNEPRDPQDVLGFSQMYGITGSYDSGAGTLTLSGTATVAQYEQALQSVTFHSNSQDPTEVAVTRSVSWSVIDADSDGAGSKSSTIVTSTINVIAENDAPDVTAESSLTYTENDPGTVIAAGVILRDVDDAQIAGARVTISSGLTEGDFLELPVQSSGIDGSYSDGVLTLTGTAAIAEYQAALRAVTYHSESSDPTAISENRTITWTVTDANSDQAGAAIGSGISTIQVVAVNTPPSITSVGSMTYTENDSATVIDANIGLDDDDNIEITEAVVTISNGLTEGDLLGWSEQGDAISGSYSNGVLTLTGTATVAEYQTALRTVTYITESNDPTAQSGSRVITWEVTDAGLATGVGTTTFEVLGQNQSPTLEASAQNVEYIYSGSSSISAPLFGHVTNVSAIEASQTLQQLQFKVTGFVDESAEWLQVGEQKILLNSAGEPQLNGADNIASYTVGLDGAAKIITLTGDWDAAEITTLLQGVKYGSSSMVASGDRTVALTQITDSGGSGSATTMFDDIKSTVSVPSSGIDGGITINALDSQDGQYFQYDESVTGNAALLGGAKSFEISVRLSGDTIGNIFDENSAFYLFSYSEAVPGLADNIIVGLNSEGGLIASFDDGDSDPTTTETAYSDIAAEQVFDGQVHTVKLSWDSSSGHFSLQLDQLPAEELSKTFTQSGLQTGGVLTVGSEEFAGTFYDIQVAADIGMDTERTVDWDMERVIDGNVRDGNFSLEVMSNIGEPSVDTLLVQESVDLTDLQGATGSNYPGLKIIDMRGGGSDTLVLKEQDLLTGLDGATLKILGDDGDVVELEGKGTLWAEPTNNSFTHADTNTPFSLDIDLNIAVIELTL